MMIPIIVINAANKYWSVLYADAPARENAVYLTEKNWFRQEAERPQG
jgi:hypothetical protein